MKHIALFLLLCLLCMPALAQEAQLVPPLTPVVPGEQQAPAQAALYCGPTQGFYRPGEDVLDTGAPFVCFGHYDCWAMVAQGTQDSFGPVGWVEAAAIDGLDSAPLLGFEEALTAMVEEDTFLTDDPLAAEPRRLCSVARGTQVLLLAQMDGWLYVQGEIDGVPVRAFVPAHAVL